MTLPTRVRNDQGHIADETGKIIRNYGDDAAAIPGSARSVNEAGETKNFWDHFANILAGPGTPTDLSGTITTGGTAQTLAAVSSTRKSLFVSNPDPTNDLWIAGLGLTAAANGQGSIRIPANGGGIGFTLGPDPVRTAWTIVGAVTGQKFTAWGC